MMNKPFIHDDFLLETKEARELYHTYAETLPIIDYHCHVPPAEIAENRKFENLTRIWLWGDHYKWRAMRTCGVDEAFITGNASDWEKFEKWAETVPKTLRNPLYHWTHLELRKPFGITDRLLGPGTARSVWDECNEKLARPEFSVRGIIQSMNVETICTTDDPVDDLRFHKQLAKDTTFPVGVFPAFRADKAMAVENPAAFASYMAKLGETAEIDIRSFNDLLEALHKRHDYFHEHNSRLSDHGLETMYVENYTKRELDQILLKLLQKQSLSPGEILQFKAAVLYELAVMDWEKGWTQQFHLGAIRNVNTRKLRILGPDTGYDSIGDLPMARPTAEFFNRLESENKLAKTILYNLNPRDNELFATMIGNFQGGTVAGKMQYGSSWWFLDQIDGMTKQIEALSNMGLLSQFVGMLTDSRSFLSYPRHEYFRRLLCNIIGRDIGRGLIPDDLKTAGKMVQDICYYNAKRYFKFPTVAKDETSKGAEKKNLKRKEVAAR